MKLEISEIARWSPQPGDRLIVRVEQLRITDQHASDIRERIRVILQLPAEFPILVTGSGVSVSVAAL